MLNLKKVIECMEYDSRVIEVKKNFNRTQVVELCKKAYKSGKNDMLDVVHINCKLI